MEIQLQRIQQYFRKNLITQGNKKSLNNIKLKIYLDSYIIPRIISTTAKSLIELRPEKQSIYFLSTISSIIKVEKVVEKLSYLGKRFLFVTTNVFHKYFVEKYALKCSEFFINKFWIKGTLSNWDEIFKIVKKLIILEKSNLPKYFSLTYRKKLKRYCRRVNNIFKGIRSIKNIPDVVIITDPNRDNSIAQECKKIGLISIGIINSNNDPDKFEYIILGNNTDSLSIDFFLNRITNCILKGKSKKIDYEM